MTKLSILKVYQKVVRMIWEYANGGVAKYHHYFVCGGRECGKTFTTEEILIAIFLVCAGIVIQELRATDKDVKKQKYSETISMLNSFNVDREDYQFKAGELTFINKLNNNLIILDSLNEQDNPPAEGGKINLPIQPSYVKRFINFYEEANQLNKILIDQHQISTRSASPDYQKINIYAWNPYRGNDWCTEIAERLLPPNQEELESVGFQYGEFPEYANGSGAIVLRVNHRINKFISPDAKQLIESIKEIDFERYKVVGLGMSGNIFNAIYQHDLLKARECNVNAPLKSGVLFGGVDPGWTESDTACVLINASKYFGVDVISEFGIMNKSSIKPEDYVKQTVTTQEQIDKVITFYKNAYYQYKKPIRVFVDNASYPDFYQLFNKRLLIHDMDLSKIEFLPARKSGDKNWIRYRVEAVRYMLSSKILGVSKSITEHVYNDLYNCYTEEVKTMHEDTQMKRSHEWTHFLNALEYSLCDLYSYYRNLNPMYFEKE